MSDVLEVVPTNLLRMRMQQLFRPHDKASLHWIESIPWSNYDSTLELVNLKNWAIFEPFFYKCSLAPKTKNEIMSLHFRSTLAQFFYGEQAAVQILNQIVERAQDTHIQQLCQKQASEEQIHYTALLQFFTNSGGGLPKINPYFKSALNTILTSKDIHLKIIGLQGLLEPAAASFLRSAIAAGLLPTLDYILKNILADEERHITFGHLCIKDLKIKLNSKDQAVCENFILRVCHDMMLYAKNEVTLDGFLKPEDLHKFNYYVWQTPDMIANRKKFFSRSVLALMQMNLLSANTIRHLREMEFM